MFVLKGYVFFERDGSEKVSSFEEGGALYGKADASVLVDKLWCVAAIMAIGK